MATRAPAVAGQFYAGSAGALRNQIADLMPKRAPHLSAIGIMTPHAGYVYSGGVAASVYAAIKPRSQYLILGPNHTGLGMPLSISAANGWKTPLGTVPVNVALRDAIMHTCRDVHADDQAHLFEHSIEVQLPFIQTIAPDASIVAIAIGAGDELPYVRLGSEIAAAITASISPQTITIVASSDMTHYEPQESALRKDTLALDAVRALDAARLITTVHDHEITMCGVMPVALMLTITKALGAQHAEIVHYQTSGDVSGDYSSVVGYAGAVIN